MLPASPLSPGHSELAMWAWGHSQRPANAWQRPGRGKWSLTGRQVKPGSTPCRCTKPCATRKEHYRVTTQGRSWRCTQHIAGPGQFGFESQLEVNANTQDAVHELKGRSKSMMPFLKFKHTNRLVPWLTCCHANCSDRNTRTPSGKARVRVAEPGRRKSRRMKRGSWPGKLSEAMPVSRSSICCLSM